MRTLKLLVMENLVKFKIMRTLLTLLTFALFAYPSLGPWLTMSKTVSHNQDMQALFTYPSLGPWLTGSRTVSHNQDMQALFTYPS